MTKPLYSLKPEELTEVIDPSLTFVKSLRDWLTKVYLVMRDQGEKAVLKTGLWMDNFSSDGCIFRHVQNESKALENLTDIFGIPKIHNVYPEGCEEEQEEEQRYFSLLKDYIDGKPLTKEMIKDLEFQERMKALIMDAGSRGVLVGSVWEMYYNNVLVKGFQPFFIDLGLSEVVPKEKRAEAEFLRAVRKQYLDFKEEFFPDI